MKRARIAEQGGADEVGGDDLVKKVEGGYLDFEVALATKEMMGKVGRLGRVLGPRGLMPNPRTNTVVEQDDLPKAIKDAKQGRVEFRTDRTNLVHVPIGKISFEHQALLENLGALVEAIVREKPTGAQGPVPPLDDHHDHHEPRHPAGHRGHDRRLRKLRRTRFARSGPFRYNPARVQLNSETSSAADSGSRASS